MKLYKSIFLILAALFSPLTYSNNADDVINSSTYLKGSMKAFYVSFIIRLKDSDNGKGGQEAYGTINVEKVNESELSTQVWHESKSNPPETLQLDISTGALLTGELRDNYFTLSGSITDADLAGNPDDRLCNLNSNVKIYQSQINQRLTNVFTGGDRQCDYLKVTHFSIPE